MSSANTSTTTVDDDAAPPSRLNAWTWVRTQLFSSPLNSLLTILSVWLLLAVVPAIVEWALIKANFTAGTAQECRASGGACWAFIYEKHRLILFGLYPFDEQWRPLLATCILLGVIVLSGWRKFWNWSLAVLWTAALIAVAVLMWGGVFGLTPVENSLWGGLPLTLILSTFGIAFAFPLGVLLALGRRSKMPAIKAICVIYIELIRGVPLISLLFMSAVMLPLFLPEGMNIDKLLRAQLAIILFAAAYIAETVRGGLQAIPKGQFEGGESLGLNYWQQMRLVVLPQALKIVIPPLVGIFIAMFKDTSLVVVIGIYDLTQAAKAALVDQAWRGFSAELYVFIAVLYFVFCYSMSKYSQSLEKRLATGYKR
jgi:general L-amino acid transport system permease protein